MAITFDANYGSNSTTSTGATVTMSPTSQINTGRKLFIICTAHNIAGMVLNSVSDNSTQSGSVNTYVVDLNSHNTRAQVAAITYCDVSRPILTSDVITATFNNAVTSKFMTIGAMCFTGIASGAKETSASADNFNQTSGDTGFTGSTAESNTVVIGVFAESSGGAPSGGDDGRGNTMNVVHNIVSGVLSAHLDEYFIEVSMNSFKSTASWGSPSQWVGISAIYPAAPATTVATDAVTARHVWR